MVKKPGSYHFAFYGRGESPSVEGPPVPVNVEVEGRTHAELHVDGGVSDWWFDGGTTCLPLDLNDAGDRSSFLELCAAADILIESEGAARLAALGLG